MQYNKLLATIAIVKDTELEKRLKQVYATNKCAKWALTKTKGNFVINKQGLI
jgi:hypothetical protein